MEHIHLEFSFVELVMSATSHWSQLDRFDLITRFTEFVQWRRKLLKWSRTSLFLVIFWSYDACYAALYRITNASRLLPLAVAIRAFSSLRSLIHSQLLNQLNLLAPLLDVTININCARKESIFNNTKPRQSFSVSSLRSHTARKMLVFPLRKSSPVGQADRVSPWRCARNM